MRIAFVSGNREKLPDAVIPLGLLYVMASTPERHDKELIDLCFEARPGPALHERLSSFRPDLVAIGMRNVQNNDYSGTRDNLAYYADLVSVARSVSDAPIILGGGGFSVMPRELMDRLKPDFGISGEGEVAFPQLVQALERGGRGIEKIGGLHRFVDANLVSNGPDRGFLDMAELSPPDRTRVDPRYYEDYGIESIQTKRGCPLRCDYCTYPLIEGRRSRLREPAAVVDEMYQALETQPGIRHFFVVDSVFNLPGSHAKNVCRELIRRGWSVPWTCYANPLGFDREFAELANAAGCAGMEIGSDSGCNEILARLKKGFTVADIRSLHQICRNAGVPDCHSFILGTRYESLSHVEQTLDFAAELDPFSAIMMIWIDDYETLDPDLRRQRVANRVRIEELLLERRTAHPHWSIPHLGINFDAGRFSRMRRSGRNGPLWQHLRGSEQKPGPGLNVGTK